VQAATAAAASCRAQHPFRFSLEELTMKIKTKVRAGRDCGGGKPVKTVLV
jgi:hypothetical protein